MQATTEAPGTRSFESAASYLEKANYDCKNFILFNLVYINCSNIQNTSEVRIIANLSCIYENQVASEVVLVS